MLERLLKSPPQAAVLFLAAILLVSAGIADQMTAKEIGLELGYILPIILTAWYSERTWAFGFAVGASGLWLLLELLDQPTFWEPIVSLWNGLTRVVLFVGIVMIVSTLRETARRGDALSRVDALTGAGNPTAFFEAARGEISRARRGRTDMTVALFDIDGFTEIESAQGRGAGERVLKTIATTIGSVTRATDVLARLHDDEFAVLFPGTGRLDAGAVLLKISEAVLKEMRENSWDVSLRMGAVTFERPPESANEMRRVVEEVLHDARTRGPNVIEHQVVGGV